MQRLLSMTAALLTLLAPPAFGRQQQPACAEFQRKLKATYDFKPSRLTEAERDVKSAAMDVFWKEAEGKRGETLPCLRTALGDARSDPWFLFDGANLLVALDPSPASEAVQARQYAAVDLDDVNLAVWVTTLARLGAEGHDVSEAGARWLAHPKATYYLPQHGAYKVERLLGGIFIFGSMDEARATPALLKLAASAAHPGREQAISLLLMQATPEAVEGLKRLDRAGLPPGAQAVLREHLERPRVITPRVKPKTSRARFLKAFERAAAGDWEEFGLLVAEVPDGEKDVVAVLKPEDLPLVRRVRRRMIARANPHAAEYYVSFTQILTTLISRPETKI
ncbi:MAG TPA: hypothetical protein VE360_00465 [Pyrinomonadaceae bacterium]|nr:hypothetical protein [Pyrinomonadaceae bacterium]